MSSGTLASFDAAFAEAFERFSTLDPVARRTAIFGLIQPDGITGAFAHTPVRILFDHLDQLAKSGSIDACAMLVMSKIDMKHSPRIDWRVAQAMMAVACRSADLYSDIVQSGLKTLVETELEGMVAAGDLVKVAGADGQITYRKPRAGDVT